jgi:hypothetical protein
MSEFVSAAPPTGGIRWEDHNGKLLIVEPLTLETGIQTVHGLTGPNEAEEFNDTLIFPKVLQGQTRGQVGKKVVGRLGQGEKKPGQSPPWVISEATPDDIEKAKSYLANKGVTSAAAPATGSTPPF